MFTDRFIKVPSRIYNNKDKDLTGIETLIDVEIKILPMEICQYYISWDDDGREGTQIMMKNGEPIWTYLTAREFEKLMNEHQK